MVLSEKNKDKFVLLVPLFWIAFFVLVFTGNGLYAMYAVLGVALVNMLLGIAEGEELKNILFWRLLVGWGSFMLIGLTGMIYYYFKFGDTPPDFLILGIHPSYAFFLIFVWLGGFLYLALSLVSLKDIWLPQKKWDDFVRYSESLNSEERGEH